jgi:hypothetical protein
MLTPRCYKLLGFRFVLTTAVLVCCATSNIGSPQMLQRPDPIIVDGSNNETTKAELDLLAEKAGTDRLIILIARLGRKEFSRQLNRQRLRTVSEYLKFTRAISADRLVTAEGEKRNEVGQVEAYVDGKLFMVFRLPRNKNFAPEP